MLSKFDEKTNSIVCWNEPVYKKHVAISNADVFRQMKLACLQGEGNDGFTIVRREPKIISLSCGLPGVNEGDEFIMNDGAKDGSWRHVNKYELFKRLAGMVGKRYKLLKRLKNDQFLIVETE